MKLALIVFLGLFAFSAQAKPSAAVEVLPISVYDFVSELLAAAGVLNEQIQTTIHTIKEIAESILFQGMQKVSDSWAKVEEQLKKYDGGRTECVKQHLPELKEAKNKLDADFKTCVEPLVEKTEETKEDLKDSMKIVVETIKSFYDIAKECASFNPIETAKCVRSHMGEFKDLVMNLIHDTEAKLKSLVEGTTELSKVSAMCIKDSMLQFNSTQKAIFKSIESCVAKNHKKPETY